MTPLIPSSSQIHSPQVIKSFGKQCLKKVHQRAEDINERSNTTHPPLLVVSFDLDNTLIRDTPNYVLQFNEKDLKRNIDYMKKILNKEDITHKDMLNNSELNDWKEIYPNKNFVQEICDALKNLANMGIPILPIMVTSSRYIRPLIMTLSSPMGNIFSPEQIYAIDTPTLTPEDKKIENSIEYHNATKYHEGWKLLQQTHSLQHNIQMREAKTLWSKIKIYVNSLLTDNCLNEEDRLIIKRFKQEYLEPLKKKLNQSPLRNEECFQKKEIEDRKKAKTYFTKSDPRYVNFFIEELKNNNRIAEEDSITAVHFGDGKADKIFVENLNNPKNYKDNTVAVDAHYKKIDFDRIFNNIKTKIKKEQKKLKNHTLKSDKKISKYTENAREENTTYQRLIERTEHQIACTIESTLKSLYERKMKHLTKDNLIAN